MEKIKAFFKVYLKQVMIGLGSLIITSLLSFFDFNYLESSLYDLRTRFYQSDKASKEIIIIAIDDKTLQKLDEFAPLPMDLHIKLLERVIPQSPKGVGYLIDLAKVYQNFPSEKTDELNERFVKLVSVLETREVPFLLGTPFDVNGEVIPPYPLSLLPHAIALIHKDGNTFGEDSITRRALLKYNGKASFHLDLAERLGFVRRGQTIRGAHQETAIDAQYLNFKYMSPTTSEAIKAGESYKVLSFIDVIENKIKPDELHNKIVLVGTINSNNSSDFAQTPFSKKTYTNPKLAVHANIIDSLMNHKSIIKAPSALNWIFTFLLVSFVIWSVLTYTPLYGVFNTFILALGFLIVCQILFSARGLWVKEAQSLIGIFLGYYLTVPYRLILEYQTRWGYQKKNEVLLQVEELKTNFLRLVTHDLKTPVARIQGLTEMVLRKQSHNLQPECDQHLKNIVSSTQELNHFITSVLELTRIESNQTVMALESKDVNTLIEKEVQKLNAKADQAQVKIELNLEPLFPIKLDPTLISKVIHNLIDNAIKYSPPQSKVTVQTLEARLWIEISVIDEGIGLSPDEMSSLFTRFYRAKNDKTTQVSGTGLGLYLTKYFVEAHKGQVHVQSTPGKGSIFKILLPTQLSIEPGLVSQIQKFKPSLLKAKEK